MMGPRTFGVKGADAQDAVGGWRRVVKRADKAGFRSGVKRRLRRRERHAARASIVRFE